MRLFFKFFYYNAGWKINGHLPNLKKYIIIVAPHTSTQDFFVGIAVRSILKSKAIFLGKKELFKFPLGTLMKWLGGMPVDRSRHNNLVDAVVELFNQHDAFVVALAPEGTRKYVKEWKTGFYYMALKAKVPVVMSALNYPDKTVYFCEAFYPTGNWEDDKKVFESFYKNKEGKVAKRWPENF